MSHYLIHACPARLWYVNDYLIPSMYEQGITDVIVDCDTTHKGNLESFMQSFLSMNGDGGTWHMNDDVMLSRAFQEKTEKYDDGLVCGFAAHPQYPAGKTTASEIWWSFPCIRIPNWLAHECAEWFYAEGREMFPEHAKTGRDDDWFFVEFLKLKHPDMPALNLKPCLVEHIDYLIGGSSIFGWNVMHTAKWFDDRDLVYELEENLIYDGH